MIKKVVVVLLLVGLLAAAIWGPIPIPHSTGKGDFLAYWSATFLLANGQNFSDHDLLLEIERTHTGWLGDFTVVTWNPPWLLALLLPYALVSFWRAVWLWLLTNILMIFVGSALLWHSLAMEERSRKWGHLAPLIGLLFAPTLVALHMGQVNTLVFFGMALFVYFNGQKRPFLSGASLVLTLVKPHLVYITLPLLMLDAVRKREWRTVLGLATALVGLTLIVFILRPTFIADYGATVSGGNLLGWETPTLGGILAVTLGWQWSKLMGILILPAAIFYWWRHKERIAMSELVAGSLLLSLITAPFGWNYDAVVLLIPLFQLILWLIEGKWRWWETAVLITLLLLANYFSLRQSTLTISEVYLFWFPLVLAAIYSWTYFLKKIDSVSSNVSGNN